jgi:hypothetical protein
LLFNKLEGARAATALSIYCIPGTIFTLTAVAPAALAGFPEVEVERITDPETIAGAIDAIIDSRPQPSDCNIDARVGLIFNDDSGDQLLAVYGGTFDWSGQIGSQRCMFGEPTLRDWIRARGENPKPT